MHDSQDTGANENIPQAETTSAVKEADSTFLIRYENTY